MTENAAMLYKFCMGTCIGQYLGVSSSVSRGNWSLARLLAGVVNLNAKFMLSSGAGQDNSCTARAQWAEIQLNGERVGAGGCGALT